MPSESSSDVKFEIGHVLFIDIVGYSKLLINEQSDQLQTLKQIVRGTEQFRLAEAEGKLLRLPTGDGGALVFRNSPEAPVICAFEISKALKNHPKLRVRMGIHSGAVNEVTDLNEQANIAGAGINIAQRVMDCGDAGHILVSRHVAEDLEQYPQWRSFLHELGEYEVKHGAQVGVVNLYGDEVGNPEPPKKFQALKKFRTRVRLVAMATALLALLAIVAGVATFSRYRAGPKLAAPEKSIAVLPFENLSSDKENAYFADGMQDEILTDLAKIADLKVISRASVMQYRGAAGRNLRAIAQQLGVAHVLEGTVQRAADKVRVNTQLINARTDAHEWAENYDRPLNDVFAIQTEIAKAIADQLQAHLSPSEKAAIEQAPTTDIVANDLYVRALALRDLANNPGAKDSLLQAISLLEEAVRRDPNFLLAYCLLCEIHTDLYWYGFDRTPARLEQAHTALQEAEQLQPQAGEVHLQKALYAYHGFRDYAQARAEFELARRTLPNLSVLYLYLAAVDRRQGRWDDAVRNFDRAIQLDPRNFFVVEEAGLTRRGLNQNAEATKLLKQAVELSPKDDSFARIALAQIPYFEQADLGPLRSQLNALLKEGTKATVNAAPFFVLCALAERDRGAAARALAFVPAEGALDPYNNFLMSRDWFVGLVARSFGEISKAQTAFAAARAKAAKTVQERPDDGQAWSMLGMIDAGLGNKSDAVAEGQRACVLLPISKDAWFGCSNITNLALIYTWVGENDRALEQLMTSAKTPFGVTYGELKLSPVWDPLRGDPGFEKIVASLAPK
jgi:TolB-like protein/class 3 adenylate cyclase/Flp pilus assembly protein TadD